MNCTYHPIYRVCRACGRAMNRSEARECAGVADLVARVETSDDALKAEGFEACRELVALLLSRVPVIRTYDVQNIGNPFAGMRNAHRDDEPESTITPENQLPCQKCGAAEHTARWHAENQT